MIRLAVVAAGEVEHVAARRVAALDDDREGDRIGEWMIARDVERIVAGVPAKNELIDARRVDRQDRRQEVGLLEGDGPRVAHPEDLIVGRSLHEQIIDAHGARIVKRQTPAKAESGERDREQGIEGGRGDLRRRD